MNKGIMLTILGGVVLSLLVGVGAGTSMADEPSLLVYPNQPTIFRYDPGRYELVTPLDPAFNMLFSVSGVMLWDRIESRIPVEVYRAPQLVGFEVSPHGLNEFVVRGIEFRVIVDGFSDTPRLYSNLCMRFIPEPSHSLLTLKLNGQFLDELITPISSLDVSTPTDDGFYANTEEYQLRWSGAAALRITVYSDKNNDRVYSGDGPQFSILVIDGVVSTEQTSWGELKALYRGP